MRLMAIGTAVILAGSLPAPAAVSNIDAVVKEATLYQGQGRSRIDPVVTGHRVTEAQFQRWEAARKLFEECGQCVNTQPYPGDELSQ